MYGNSIDSALSLHEVSLRPLNVLHSIFPTTASNFTSQHSVPQQHTVIATTESSIKPDHYELFTAIAIPLLLVHAARLGRMLLLKLSSYRALGHERQASIAALVAVILGKIGLVGFSAPLLYGSWDTAESMRFRTAYIIHASIYIFDMTFRKPNLSLWIHHLTAIGATAFVLWYHAEYSAHDLYYIRGMSIFYVFAVGLADLGADFAMLGYYLSRSSPWLAGFVENAAHYLVGMRTIQWSTFVHLNITHTPANPWCIYGMMPVYMIWMREEYAEWVVITGLGKKLRSSMQKSFFEKSEMEKAVVAAGDKIEPKEVVMGRETVSAAPHTLTGF